MDWLKAAEGLFEVVDRRAKLAVGDKPDEQPNFQPPVSNGQESQKERKKPELKPREQVNSDEPLKAIDTEKEQINTAASRLEAESGKDKAIILVAENDVSGPHNVHGEAVDKEHHISDGVSIEEASSPVLKDQGVKPENDPSEVALSKQAEVVVLNPDLERANEDSLDIFQSSMPQTAKDIDHSSQNTMTEITKPPAKTEHEGTTIMNTDEPVKAETHLKEVNPEKLGLAKNKYHQRSDTVYDLKIQEQLDEARGLLKNAKSSGQSKEARLARVCAGLSSRLQEYKSENAQLEELLIAERELSKSYEEHIKQLQNDLSLTKSEVTRAESSMSNALAAKNAEIEALVNSMDTLKKQAALSEGNLASLQASMESLMRNRELTETRMMQALREELATAERRAEEERAAHNATKMAAMEREVELEHRAIDASTALARIQRTADERTAKAAELEQKVALLEVECSSLNQELQDLEARARRGQKKSPEEANQVMQMQAWQEEVERARRGQREAESKLSSMEAEVQKMRVEMGSMKRDAEHYSRQEHVELEKRYRELTDLLYYKQTQLETMASEKAAAEFQLEKELKRLQEAQVEAERNRASRRASSSWEEDAELKKLETLPLHRRHMVGASMQLQKAVKLLDSGAVRATRFLWRYPTARVALFFYLVFVHLFLMYLLHRLQEQADTYTSREFEESMGLANRTLP